MKNNLVLIGFGLGWVIGGPIGFFIGGVMGVVFDFYFGKKPDNKSVLEEKIGDYGVAIIILSASVINSQIKHSKKEYIYVKQYLEKEFGLDVSEIGMELLYSFINVKINIPDFCKQFKENISLESRLKLLQYFFGIAISDNILSYNEIKILKTIAFYLGIVEEDYNVIFLMYEKKQEEQFGSSIYISQKEKNAYSTLGVSEKSTDDEIKNIYRKLAIKYHPDKVSHLGKAFIDEAEEKFQDINIAYQYIKKIRGIK